MKTKQTTLIIPEPLLKTFQLLAKSQAKSMTALIRDWMEIEVDKYNKQIAKLAVTTNCNCLQAGLPQCGSCLVKK